MGFAGYAAAAAALGGSIYGADQQRKASNTAADAQKASIRQAARQAQLQEEQFNKANAKTANADEFLAENVKQARKGVSGTILTSPTGVAGQPLGGNSTLLGG
jgi:uncharacterized protein HemX